MALTTINIGNIANDGTGDDLREAFIKVNNNFNVLNNILDATDTDAENLGTGEGIFAQKSGEILQFKSLHGGANITLTSSGNSITITGSPSINDLLITTDNGSHIIEAGNPTFPINGGVNTTTRINNKSLFVDIVGPGLLSLDTTPTLSANLNADGRNISAAGTVTANKFLGPLDGLVYNIDIRKIQNNLTSFELGSIKQTVTNVIEWLVFVTDFDFGTYAQPTPITIDGGLF